MIARKYRARNRKDDSEREEERLERKRGQTEEGVEAGETWVDDGDERRRDHSREKEEVHDAAGAFGVLFGAVTAKPRAEDERGDEERDDADEGVVDGEHVYPFAFLNHMRLIQNSQTTLSR